MKKIINLLLFVNLLIVFGCSNSDNEQTFEKDKLIGNWKHIQMIVDNKDVIDDCRKKSFGTVDESLNFRATLYRPTANDCNTSIFQDKITKIGDLTYKIGNNYEIKLISEKTFSLIQENSNVTDIWEKQ